MWALTSPLSTLSSSGYSSSKVIVQVVDTVIMSLPAEIDLRNAAMLILASRVAASIMPLAILATPQHLSLSIRCTP